MPRIKKETKTKTAEAKKPRVKKTAELQTIDTQGLTTEEYLNHIKSLRVNMLQLSKCLDGILVRSHLSTKFRDEAKVIVEGSDGKYNLVESLAGIISYYQNAQNNDDRKKGLQLDNQLKELELEKKKGNLVTIEDILSLQSHIWGGLVRKLRDLAIQIAPQLNPMDSDHAQNILEAAMNKVIDETRKDINKHFSQHTEVFQEAENVQTGTNNDTVSAT